MVQHHSKRNIAKLYRQAATIHIITPATTPKHIAQPEHKPLMPWLNAQAITQQHTAQQ